jgi:hypothetical protein
MAKEKAKVGCWCCIHFCQSEAQTDCGICSMAITSENPELEEMADAIRACGDEPCRRFEYDVTLEDDYEVEGLADY